MANEHNRAPFIVRVNAYCIEMCTDDKRQWDDSDGSVVISAIFNINRKESSPLCNTAFGVITTPATACEHVKREADQSNGLKKWGAKWSYEIKLTLAQHMHHECQIAHELIQLSWTATKRAVTNDLDVIMRATHWCRNVHGTSSGHFDDGFIMLIIFGGNVHQCDYLMVTTDHYQIN